MFHVCVYVSVHVCISVYVGELYVHMYVMGVMCVHVWVCICVGGAYFIVCHVCVYMSCIGVWNMYVCECVMCRCIYMGVSVCLHL